MDIPALTLLEFNRRVARLMQHESVQRCWIVAETSDVRVSGGHCYLELVQKDPDRGTTVARSRAVIWANRYAYLRHSFESETGQAFGSGLKVMVEVSVNFHEQYGYSLLISAINPTYTIGDMARQRLEILRRLKEEGIIDMNRQLPWPEVAQRVAVVSAAGAAGYGDFVDQLHRNSSGIKFYTCLFPAVMQGVNTVPSIIAALERINAHADLFDCVVIIRGGGTTSELNAFDNYDLAVHVANFPLPVISGIGHDRDNTVLDAVASVRVKTPTAAAAWLIDRAEGALSTLNALSDAVVEVARQMLTASRQQLAYFSSTIPLQAQNIVVRHRARLQSFAGAIPVHASGRIAAGRRDLAFIYQNVQQVLLRRLERELQRVDSLSKQVDLLSPERVLRRGYSLTLKDGRVVTDASCLRRGDVLTSRFDSGEVQSVVE